MRFRPGRPFRRPGPALFGARFALGAGLLPVLMEANRLFAAGQPAEAAQLFIQLAEKAEANGNLRRAARLYLEATRSLLQAGDTQSALAHARTALQLFTQIGNFGRAEAVYQHILRELRARGLTAEADALERHLQEQFGEATDAPEPAPAPRGRLPAKCPQCGGPVRSDEVDWIDEHSAECLYCGSVVPTE
jgi:tetratricopeptide (TPR) repeat protein